MKRAFIALLVFIPLVFGDNCCWCGKRYVAKEGYWEGSSNSPSVETVKSKNEWSSPNYSHNRYIASNFYANAEGKLIFPFGFFVSWGGWLAESETLLNEVVGNIVQPVSPYHPGGFSSVERYLQASEDKNILWNFDLKHAFKNLTELRSQVLRFKDQRSIFGWYLADEPDGPGDKEGLPVGVPPAKVHAAYTLVKQFDPSGRPLLVTLNCLHSATLYADVADIFLVDPYPVGIDTAPCTDNYGCCGCDGCTGSVRDVARRLDTVGAALASKRAGASSSGGVKPIWAVLQAFGGSGGHWSREPTPAELRCMTYLALMHGASGIMYWLQTSSESPLIEAARVLYREVDLLSGLRMRPSAQSLEVTLQIPREDEMDVFAFAVAQQDDHHGKESITSRDLSGSQLIVLVANMLNESIPEVSVSIAGLESFTGHAVDIFADSKESISLDDSTRPGVLVQNGQIQDTRQLTPFGTRAYQIHIPSSGYRGQNGYRDGDL